MKRAVLCIFARAPVPGRVKSRLAAEVGERQALQAHCELVEDTLSRLADLPGGIATELWLDDVEHAGGHVWARRWKLPLRAQAGADLGERMHRALLASLQTGLPGLVVGTDCPGIDAGYVADAVVALDAHDVVLGPAADGGYVLVGARRPVPEIFHDVAWGTSEVLEQTFAAATSAGLSVARLEETWDVDTAADWQRFRRLRGRGDPPG